MEDRDGSNEEKMLLGKGQECRVLFCFLAAILQEVKQMSDMNRLEICRLEAESWLGLQAGLDE